ncbi:MAG: DUF3095 family protein, partial [Brevinematia bacterium]
MNKTLNSFDFYKNVPEIDNLKKLDFYKDFCDFPEDWVLFLCDVRNSTTAIKQGKYKSVNVSSVFCIVSIANLVGSLDFPFVFGGDGVTFLIHNSYLEDAKYRLASVKYMIKSNFELDMRVGYISVKELYENGYDLKVAKYKVSKAYSQALLYGSALPYFESRVKNNQNLLVEEYRDNVNLSGFSCRWQDITTSKDEQIALIVESVEFNDNRTIKEIIDKIYEIYGPEDNWHPLSIDNMNTVSPNSMYVDLEAMVTGNPKFAWLRKLIIILQLKLVNFFSKLPFKVGIKVNYQDITDIKLMNYVSSDFRKIENSLKLIINTTKEQKEKLIEYLENLRMNNKIYYGYYGDKKAHMTCVVYLNKKQDVHFIDVVNGGFTNASMMLKKQKLSQA